MVHSRMFLAIQCSFWGILGHSRQFRASHAYSGPPWLILDILGSDGSSRKKSSPSESESYKVEPDRVRVLTRLLSYESEPSRASLDES